MDGIAYMNSYAFLETLKSVLIVVVLILLVILLQKCIIAVNKYNNLNDTKDTEVDVKTD